MSSIENNLYLTRFVNNKERYIKVNYSKTLFDDIYLVQIIFGAKSNLKPTGIKIYYFYSLNDAIDYFNKYLKIKYKKGYL